MRFSVVVFASALLALTHAFVPGKFDARRTLALRNDLFSDPSGGEKKEMSKALPFITKPKILDGSLAGDAGFE